MVEAKLIYINPNVKDAEHIGLEIIASVLEKNGVNFALHYIMDMSEVEAANVVIPEAAVYGFYLSLENYELVAELAQKIKLANSANLVVLGGVLASSAAGLVLEECQYFDYIVMGDGEYTFFSIVQAFPDREAIEEIPGVFGRYTDELKSADSVNISRLPLMNRTLLEKSLAMKNYWARIYTNRKCFGNCSFCCVNYDGKATPKKEFRERDLDSVIAEMNYLHAKYGLRCFIFNDASLEDSHQGARQKITEFCDKVIANGLRVALYSNFRAETFRIADAELMEKMKAAGFVQVFLGIESNNVSELKLYRKRATVDDNYLALNTLKKYDIRTHLGYIMLTPYSTEATLKTNFNFLVELNQSMITNYISRLVPYYKTPIYFKMLEDGLIREDYSFKNPDNFDYQEEYAASVNEVLQKKIYPSSILAFDDELTNYEKLLLYLNRIHDGQYLEEIEAADALKDEVATLNREYFKLLYLDLDVEKADEYFTDYASGIHQCYNKLRIMKVRMMKQRRITNFIL